MSYNHYMRIPTKALLTKVLIISSFLFLSQLIFPQTKPAKNKKAAAHKQAKKEKKQLEGIKTQIDGINTKISKLDSEKKSLLGQIYRVELEYDKAVIENRQLKLQMRKTQREIKNKTDEQKKLEQDIRDSKEKLRKILRVLYKLGGNSYLKLFIRVDNLDQLFHNYQRFNSLIKGKAHEIDHIKKTIVKLNQVKKDLEQAHDSLAQIQQLQEIKLSNIRALKAKKIRMVSNINNDKDNYRKLLNELTAEEARLTEMIYGEKSKRPLPKINLRRLRGRLRWPVRGKVISTYGKHRSTKFNTYIINNGIKISPTGSDRIQAVYYGIVKFAEYYKGYGNLIIIQHSPKLFTMYGHCEKLLKTKGDRVKEGQVIATVGSSGSAYRKMLHFELRVDEDAKNPLRWLKRRRR